ncbi:MAG: hypothetical protein JWO25_2907 [Alphaproteobacteria bacterium]|nr:hypothetical protein [Alphaproteobacteria bacterium]
MHLSPPDPMACVETSAMRPRHGEARGRILRAFDALLRSSPADTISIDAIAAAARLSRRTVFNQFETKDALFRASREALFRQVVTQMPPEDLPARERDGALRTFVAALAEAFAHQAHCELALSVVRDGPTQAWLARAYRDWVWRPAVQTIQLHLLSRDGGADSRQTAQAMVGLICLFACGQCPVPIDRLEGDRRPELADLAVIWASRPRPTSNEDAQLDASNTFSRGLNVH